MRKPEKVKGKAPIREKAGAPQRRLSANLFVILRPEHFGGQQVAQPHQELRNEPWMEDCRIWMYRGAWAEWEIDHIEMAVPISPEELRFKRNSILKHQSQMENAPFLGDDDRLFWQRAEERNRATAQLYENLGLASYEAMEAFVEYHPVKD